MKKLLLLLAVTTAAQISCVSTKTDASHSTCTSFFDRSEANSIVLSKLEMLEDAEDKNRIFRRVYLGEFIDSAADNREVLEMLSEACAYLDEMIVEADRRYSHFGMGERYPWLSRGPCGPFLSPAELPDE